MHILIVKTSSLGDIVQTFPVLNDLHQRFPGVAIDWVVDERFAALTKGHPLISKTISLKIKGKGAWKTWGASLRELRSKKYDIVFDLQGNCKSGGITALSRAQAKVGFGWRSVREWPNILSTHYRYEISLCQNIRFQHLELIERFLQKPSVPSLQGVRFHLSSEEKNILDAIRSLPLQYPKRVMVCPGSKWKNKQIPPETLIAFLKKVQQRLSVSFLLMWGDALEKSYCEEVALGFTSSAAVIDRLSFATWQNLMAEMELVIAVDSSALHLCGTTLTPSFSMFGPTVPEVFKPIGPHHFAFRGGCPYGRSFVKTCPLLRTCPTGACLRERSADEIYHAFIGWWDQYTSSSLLK